MNHEASTLRKAIGISYKTAWELFKDGKLNRLTIYPVDVQGRRVSGSEPIRGLFTVAYLLRENTGNLDHRRKRLLATALRKGYTGEQGHNRSRFRDKRHPQNSWLSLTARRMEGYLSWSMKEQFTRFGFAGYNSLAEY